MAKGRSRILKLKDSFTKVPNKLRDLGPFLSKEERRIYPYAISVYLIFAGSSEGFNPGIRYLTTQLGISKDTAQKALDFLVTKNLLRHVRSQDGCRDEYEFTTPAAWQIERQWFVKGKESAKKDSSNLVKDTLSDTTGQLPSCRAGHNNERSPMKETINDDERVPTASFSSQEEEKPKEEKETDWLDEYWARPSDLKEYEVWMTASEIDRIFGSAQRVFRDPKTRRTFRQLYIPALNRAFSEYLGEIIKQGKVPVFCPEILTIRLDFYLKQRFKESDLQKPFMQFDGYICQDLRNEAKALFHEYHRFCEDQRIRHYIEKCNPVANLCEAIGFSGYLETLSEVEKELESWARLYLGAPLREQSTGIIEYVLKSWIACSGYRAKHEFDRKLSILSCDLWLAFSQKAKFLVPEWADRSVEDFFYFFYSDVGKLERMCNTTPRLWAWEEKIRLGEVCEDRNNPVGFLEFLQKTA